MKIAVYPGAFDPITLGHVDLIQRAARIFDKVVVGVAEVVAGKCMLLSISERVQLVKDATAHLSNVEVQKFSNLLVEFCRSVGAQVIVRGLRALTDFERELKMATMNRQITPTIETVFMVPAQDYFYISSSLVKELVMYGAEVNKLLPEVVETYLRKKLKS